MNLQHLKPAAVKSILRRFLKAKMYRQGGPGDSDSRKALPLDVSRVDNFEQYRDYARRMTGVYAERSQLESGLVPDDEQFNISGHCAACGTSSRFHVDFQHAIAGVDGKMTPNWRERLVCEHCGLNNRMRACLHIFELTCAPARKDSIYITEQTTPLYEMVRRKYQNVTGSEYLGSGVSPGKKNFLGIRNESLTDLSFADESFDYILCFDVLEHVPDYNAAIRECFRVMKPGGTIVFSVPFDLHSDENIVRACLTPHGEIKHILSPEYHGDPINESGCLCFYHFGWSLLGEFRKHGFKSSEALFYWSRDYGYLGGDQFLFMAQK